MLKSDVIKEKRKIPDCRDFKGSVGLKSCDACGI